MPRPKELILYTLLLVMELLPAFAVLVGTSLLDATTWGYGLIWPLVAVATIGLLSGLIVAELHWRTRLYRTVLLGIGAVAVAVPALLVADGAVSFIVSGVLLGLAFWRGLAVLAEPPDHGEVERRFAYGFGILFFGILWVIARGIIGQRAIWQMLAVVGVAFVIASMVALVTARIDRVREPGAGFAVALAVLIQLGALVLISLLALQIFALDLAGFVGHATQPLFDALGRDLSNLLGYVADPIDRFVALIRPHHKSGARITPPTQGGDQFNGKRPKYHPPLQTPWVVIGALIVSAALVAGLGYLIWRSIPRRRHGEERERPYREERRSLVSPAILWAAFVAWLRSLFRGGTRAMAGVVGTTRRQIWGPDYPADPVRRSYAQMLRRAGSLGLTRPSSATPAEFLERLARRWPDARADLESVTAGYVTHRYGETPLDPMRAAAVKDAWQRVRSIMRGPSAMAQAAEAGRGVIAKAAGEPARDRPSRPFPREGGRPQFHEEHDAWRPTGVLLIVLSFAAPVLVIMVFLIILALASGHLGG